MAIETGRSTKLKVLLLRIRSDNAFSLTHSDTQTECEIALQFLNSKRVLMVMRRGLSGPASVVEGSALYAKEGNH